eukprot:498621_1
MHSWIIISMLLCFVSNSSASYCSRFELKPVRCLQWNKVYCKPQCSTKCNESKCNRAITCCDDKTNNERIVFANRNRGDVVLIEEGNEFSSITIPLYDNSEPVYVRNTRLSKEIWISDRGNNKLFVYDTIRYKQAAVVDGCQGQFHQAYNFENQLWVVCDIDLTILVINVPNKKIMKSIKIKNINGFKPHDITTTTPYTYVTLLSTEPTTEDIGWIIQYSTQTLKELKRIQIGSDPHVYSDTNNLYAVSQSGNLLYKYSADILTEIDTIHINGAHGIFGNVGGEYLWVTDITSDDGKHSIYVIDLNTFTLINAFDAIVGNPHNVRSNDEATKLFITDSEKDIVTAYDLIDGKPINGRIIFDDEGSVPFGIMNVIGG